MSRHPRTSLRDVRPASRLALSAAGGVLVVALSACGSSTSTTSSSPVTSASVTISTSTPSALPSGGSASSGMPMSSSAMSSSGSMSGMDADGSGAPAGMTAASHPRYPVGSHVVLTADHEMGMKGAKATIVGAYSTITYAVDYMPTTGGAMVKDHKWVVQQEIRDAGTKRLATGTPVVITADHMPGMQGAHGTVVQSTTQTVYMVDWDMGGMMMRNHKWVVESEIRPAS